MKYRYTPPVAERHTVKWVLDHHPGIYDPGPREPFSSEKLCETLVKWLDEHAKVWSFSSDWDFGDDSEECHLTVPSRDIAEAFMALALSISDAWVAADRDRMPIRLFLVLPDGQEEEIARVHEQHNVIGVLIHAMTRRAISEELHFSGRDVANAVDEMLAQGETERTVSFRNRLQQEPPADSVGYAIRIKVLSPVDTVTPA